MPLRNARHLATQAMQALLRPGDIAVDATLGNGHDALMLAQAVGEGGQVYGFDVQAAAVAAATGRLAEAGLLHRARFLCAGHETMAQHVPAPVRGIMFNLGWLPGGDKRITTRVETTLTAIRAALALLDVGGLLSVCVYPGHDEGDRERAEVAALLGALPVDAFSALHHRFINYPNDPPELFLVERTR